MGMGVILCNLFGVNVPFVNSTGWVGIALSVLIVGIAAANLALDFQDISDGLESGAPKWMEWYLGFGLMVTIVWLYLEMIELLAKVKDD
jgi:uncharacterized YccA/Bax inhibitor family protein